MGGVNIMRDPIMHSVMCCVLFDIQPVKGPLSSGIS